MKFIQEFGSELFRLPFSGLFLTLGAYQLASVLARRLGSPTWANPVLIAIAIVVGTLEITRTNYSTYFDTAKFIHLLLGPTVVALAIPLYNNLRLIQGCALPILCGVTAGGASAAASAVSIGWILGAPKTIILSLAPKSVTTAIAMRVSEQIGGLPEVTAVLVILTGILGAMITLPILQVARLDCLRSCGLAAGVAGHGIGSAHMLSLDETAGAFAGLGMGLCGVLTGILMPSIFAILH
jgi:predicted murein hydrolase (TIGR00659 family)